MLGRLFRRSTPPDPELDRLRNAAIAAWIHTWPEDHRLDAFLAGIEPGRRREVRRSAHAIRKAIDRLFHVGGIDPGPDWEERMRARLRRRFPWMSDETFSILLVHLQWESK